MKNPNINVTNYIQKNYTPYDGDEKFLHPPTPKTLKIWETIQQLLTEEQKHRVLSVDTKTPATITAFPPGYINKEDDVIIGLQTDEPLKRAMMPRGGWRTVETALKELNLTPNPQTKETFTKHRKTHNDTVFDVYTPRVRAARSSHLITGLPDAYCRGRIIGDYRRVALYGTDYLIEQKQHDKTQLDTQPFTPEWAQLREEISEQIRALKDLTKMAATYNQDITKPAKNAKQAIQWTYFAYLAAIKSTDGAATSLGRLSAFFDIYIEKDLKEGKITETQAQELIDNFIIKLRIIRFLRQEAYDLIFAGDPIWATLTLAGTNKTGESLVTKTDFRILQTLRNLGSAPEPNITVLWDETLPEGFRNFCSAISIETSAIQYENDKTIKTHWGDDAAISCCVSPLPGSGSEGIQFFGARANLGKTLLYALNKGKDEITGKQVIPEHIITPVFTDPTQPLDYNKVQEAFTQAMGWVAETYIEALNIIHWSHDKYAYEAVQFALIDTNPNIVLGCGIAGLSIVTDSLSAIKHAKVYPIINDNGLIIDYRVEGDFPLYGNDDDKVDTIAQETVQEFMEKIQTIPTYRNAKPTQSVLTITSNVNYGKNSGNFPSGHRAGTPFAPGANPSNGADTHGMLASMLSVAKLQYENALDGISLTNTITPQGLGKTKTEQITNLTGILDAGFTMGLYHANINVLDKNQLQDAYNNPDEYPNLVVRVSGYAVNFAKLTPEQKLDVLNRTFHGH